jgi:hypothetical protein
MRDVHFTAPPAPTLGPRSRATPKDIVDARQAAAIAGKPGGEMRPLVQRPGPRGSERGAPSISADRILAHLEGVRRHRGDGWRAKCPAHAGKSSNSLAINEAQDGRILLHCFGGCAAAEVLAAIGLGLHDLFPGRPPRAGPTPHGQRIPRLSARDALLVVAEELAVAQVVIGDARRGLTPNEQDWARFLDAAGRIERIAREAL